MVLGDIIRSSDGTIGRIIKTGMKDYCFLPEAWNWSVHLDRVVLENVCFTRDEVLLITGGDDYEKTAVYEPNKSTGI